MKLSFLKRLIARYRDNKATPVERYILERWYDSFDQDKKQAAWLSDESIRRDFEIRVIAQATKIVAMNRSLHRRMWIQVAATLLIACSVTFLLYRFDGARPDEHPGIQTAMEISTGQGQLKKVLLPDSSEVLLNANSTLMVPEGFGGKQRAVHLLGEAFFDVKPDRTRPFTVGTTELDVRVLGTSFSVKAYEIVDHIQVVVAEGRVGVSDGEGLIAELSQNDQLSYDKTSGQSEVAMASTGSHSWITGRTVLDRASFQELAQAFVNLYGLQLESDDTTVLNARYNLTIRRGRPATQALEHLCTLIGKKYRKEGDKRIIIY